MNKLILGFVLAAFLIGAGPAWAQEAAGPVVDEILITGLDRVNEHLVRSRIESQVGERYSPRTVARDIRRLYELGYFSNIVVETRGQLGSFALVYRFTEKRFIDEIRITGNRKVKDRDIRGVISWREGDTFVPEAYDQEREAVLGLYRQKGYAAATVDIVVEEIGRSRVQILYVVEEGKKARVKSIEFEGNEALSDRQLRKAIQTKRSWWFLGGKFDPGVFEGDTDRIVDRYGNEGRLEAEVDQTRLDYRETGKKLDITIYVTEGPEYTVETLDVANNVVYDDDEVAELAKVREGDVHDKGQLAADAELIQKGYEDSGYVNAYVQPQVTLDRTNKTTHVVHQISEGDLKYIREIKITGNTVTRDDVIRRQLLVNPGDRFDGSLLRASQARLDGLDYFDQVRMNLQNLDDDDARWSNLLIDVEEGKTSYFNFGAGYSTDEGLGGFAELRFNNFDITDWPSFSGGGQQFNLRLHVGERRNEYNLGFTDPEIFGYPIIFGFDVFNESFEYSGGTDYTEQRTGAQIRFGKILSHFVQTRLAFRYEDTQIEDLPWYAFITYPRDYWEQREGTTTIAAIWGITRDTTDNRRDPNRGSVHMLELEFAGLGGDNHFYKVQHDSKWYFPITGDDRWVLMYRTREGFVQEYGDSDFVPLQDRLYAGGTATVRGYDSRDIGPQETGLFGLGETVRVGGNLRLIQNLELRYKLNDMIRLYGFADAGGVWRDSGDFSLSDMRYSLGLGLGFDIPRMGPIRIDYGFPINPDDDQGNGRLHLMSGFAF